MTRPPEGEPREPDGSDIPDVSETGVGWPEERPRPAAPAPSGPATGAGAAPFPSQPARYVRPPEPPGPPGIRRRAPEPAVPERPGNVTAAAVILFVGAGLAVLGCCSVTYLSGQAELSAGEQNLALLVSAILLVSAAANGVLGYYLLQGRQWARVTTIVLCAIGIIGSVVNQFASAGGAETMGPFGACLGVILNALVIGLLSGERAGFYFRFAHT